MNSIFGKISIKESFQTKNIYMYFFRERRLIRTCFWQQTNLIFYVIRPKRVENRSAALKRTNTARERERNTFRPTKKSNQICFCLVIRKGITISKIHSWNVLFFSSFLHHYMHTIVGVGPFYKERKSARWKKKV